MSRSIHFREGAPGDGDAVMALREVVHPQGAREKRQPDFWEWFLVKGYAGMGRVFVAEAGDRIVGHFAFVPQRYAAGTTLRGALALDVMTHPEFRRQKVFSRLASFAAERLRNDFQVVAALQFRRAVLGGMLAGGWRPALLVPVLLRPLSLRRIAYDSGLPVDVPADEGSAEPVRDSIRPIRPSDWEQIDALVATGSIRQARSAEFLKWRYRQNPHWQYEMEGFFEGDKLRAFLIHRESVLRGFRTLAIADAGLFPGSDESFRQLVRHACRSGRRRGIGLAAALISRPHPAYGPLIRSGFFPGPHRFRLLLQVFDQTLRWIGEAPWSLSWGDTDHL